MGKTATNISLVLGIVTIVFAGYYLYTQSSLSAPKFATSEQTRQNLLNNTRVFREYRQTLGTIEMDTSVFSDERFRSLKSFSTRIEESEVGREDPFARVTAISNSTP